MTEFCHTRPYKVSKTNERCITYEINIADAATDFWVSLNADIHADSKHFQEDLFHKNMKKALQRHASVVIFGDFYDIMQGKTDRRGHKSALRPELAGDNYLNLVRNYGVKLLAPYAQIIDVISPGNHETAKLTHQEYDVMEDTIEGLTLKHGASIIEGQYSGWLRFQFTINKTRRQTFKLYYHHGAGGSAPVTRGTIKTNRRNATHEADIVCSGHIHEAWMMETPKVRLSKSGRETIENVTHLQLPSYKRVPRGVGWEEEQEFAPQPLGGWWLHFYRDGDFMAYEVIRAQ